MRMASRRRLLRDSVLCACLAVIWAGGPAAAAEERVKKKAGRTEAVTLQYRVARDAFAPSRFVAVTDQGVSAPLGITWDLPKAEDQEKKEFDALINTLEERQINGVEFECTGEWAIRGGILRITTVPRLTPQGKKRIEEHAR